MYLIYANIEVESGRVGGQLSRVFVSHISSPSLSTLMERLTVHPMQDGECRPRMFGLFGLGPEAEVLGLGFELETLLPDTPPEFSRTAAAARQ